MRWTSWSRGSIRRWCPSPALRDDWRYPDEETGEGEEVTVIIIIIATNMTIRETITTTITIVIMAIIIT